MQPQRLIGLAALAVGIILLVMGFRATESFGSQVSEFFTGSPTDKAVWLIIGGAVLAIVGAGIAFMPLKLGKR